MCTVNAVAGLLTVEDALARVLERVQPLETETVPLAEATGRVLGEDALAALDLPPLPELRDGRLRAPRRGHAG